MMEIHELIGPSPLEFFVDPNIQAADLTDGAILFRHVQENRD